ncbi:MAG: HDOD domain-containing protein [Acidimicrobiales bacterium]|nr:HDOD domain-containing protein [Acidimicrobiales bacterium]MCB9395602.1 HDOD domain-containing protein [Acidimicrobiaceae bacterium]
MVSPATRRTALLRDRLLVHPRAAQRVLELLAVPDGAHAELCALVELDPALTAAVLRAANSAHLGFSRRIAGIRHATVLLGGSLVASLAASRVADLVFDTAVPDYPDWLWQHSVVVASSCAVLAPYVGESTDDAFTTGMLHDVGTLVSASNGESADHVDASPEHAEIGADLLQRWNLPDAVVDGVRHHHARPDALVGGLERLVAASSAFAEELGAGGPERGVSMHDAVRLVRAPRRPDELLAAIEDEVTRRTAVVRGR